MVDLYPSKDFWESDLEMPITHLLSNFQSETVCRNWLFSLSGRQLNVIFRQLLKNNDDISLQQKRAILMDCPGSLLHYYLLSHFNHSKCQSAIAEVAKSALNEELVSQFLCKNNKYDKKSLIFLLFHHNPELIKCVYHFDRVQKRGFHPFILHNPPRQMKTPFKHFLSKQVVHELLHKYDAEKNDGFETQLQCFFYHHDRIYIFIRRAGHKDLLFNSNRIIHGHRLNRIILDFSLHGNQLNLSAKNPDESLKIANSIVCRYFQCECSFVDMQEHNCTPLVISFLKSLLEGDDPHICPFEVKFRSTQLKKDTYLVVATNPTNSIVRELQMLKLTEDDSVVESIRVMFQSKKVTLFFKRNQHYTIIHYSEHILNKEEREDFKSLMKKTYGLTILPKANYCRCPGVQ